MTSARPYWVSIDTPCRSLRAMSPLDSLVYPEHQRFARIERFKQDTQQDGAHLKPRPDQSVEYLMVTCVIIFLRASQYPQHRTDPPFSSCKEYTNHHFLRPIPSACSQNACANGSITVIIKAGKLIIFTFPARQV